MGWRVQNQTYEGRHIVEKINNYLRETVLTTVITRQYTVQMVVTNRKLPIRRHYDPTIIMAGTVTANKKEQELQDYIDYAGSDHSSEPEMLRQAAQLNFLIGRPVYLFIGAARCRS